MNTEESVHLEGSPRQLEVQREGVRYALNCGGPTYTATNHITYTSEHRQFASFSYDFNCGKLSWVDPLMLRTYKPMNIASSPTSPTTLTVVSCRGLIHSCWEPINTNEHRQFATFLMTSTVVSCRGLIHSCWEPINQRTSAVCHFSYDFNCGNLL